MVGGGWRERKKFRRAGGVGCNGGTIEVVGGGRGEREKFRWAGGGGVVNLDIFGVLKFSLVVVILFELEEESLVLLSSSNSAC